MVKYEGGATVKVGEGKDSSYRTIYFDGICNQTDLCIESMIMRRHPEIHNAVSMWVNTEEMRDYRAKEA